MAQPFAIRRASIYRQHAQQLTETAAHLSIAIANICAT
jgi:hypothetical protein